jgi:hypothetical protein
MMMDKGRRRVGTGSDGVYFVNLEYAYVVSFGASSRLRWCAITTLVGPMGVLE